MTNAGRGRWRWVAVIVILVAAVGGVAAGLRASGPIHVVAGPYGPGIGADGLANTQVGGPSSGSADLQTSFRFRAGESGLLKSARIYLADGTGYSGGTGGEMTISVEADSGAPNHEPAGAPLASAAISPGNPVVGGYLPLIPFPAPASLVRGQLYHLVFKNTDPSPVDNFVSVNALWTQVATSPRQPSLADLDWAELINDGSGWTVRPNYTPILDLGYTDGSHQGVGYMEVWIDLPEAISGTSAVRELFTPTSSRSVTSIAVRVSRTDGGSPLTVRLAEAATGKVVGTASAAASSFGSDPVWVTVSLAAPVVLTAGAAYELDLTSTADSSYSAFALERGNHYDFDPATFFTDGHGEYTTSGTSWLGFNQPNGTSNNSNSDLQFYFP